MKNLIPVLALVLSSSTAFANSGLVTIRGDLYKSSIKVNCGGESEGPRGGDNADDKSITLTDGNQDEVSGEVTLAPTKAQQRKFFVKVDGTYKPDGSGNKVLSIKFSTQLGGHSVENSGDSVAELKIDEATYSCQIENPAK